MLEISLTDKGLKTENIKEIEIQDVDIQFVTFKTDVGDFQLSVYNGHNGYYGHKILVLKESIETLLEETI